MKEIIDWLSTNGIELLKVIGSLLLAGMTYSLGRITERNNKRKEKDQKTLDRFIKFLPFETVKYIFEHDFRGAFSINLIEILDKFHEESKNPDIIFLDKKMESFRIKLVNITKEFKHLLALNSSPIDKPELVMSKIPNDYEFPDRTQFITLTNKLDQLADEIFDTYKLLIQSAKKNL